MLVLLTPCHLQGTRQPFRATDSRHNSRVERLWGEVNIRIIKPVKDFAAWVENEVLQGDNIWTGTILFTLRAQMSFSPLDSSCVIAGDSYSRVALGSLHRILLPALKLACVQLVRPFSQLPCLTATHTEHLNCFCVTQVETMNARRVQGPRGGIPNTIMSFDAHPDPKFPPQHYSEEYIVAEYERGGPTGCVCLQLTT